jgi:hypothetical protein
VAGWASCSSCTLTVSWPAAYLQLEELGLAGQDFVGSHVEEGRGGMIPLYMSTRGWPRRVPGPSRRPPPHTSAVWCTDKKENKIFLIYKEIQMGAVAKSFMRKGFLIYEDMRKYLVVYEH